MAIVKVLTDCSFHTRSACLATDRSARSRILTSKTVILLLLLGTLLIASVPSPTWAQFTHTQITNSTGGSNFEPSINADGTKIAFESFNNLTGGNPDGNPEIFLWTSGSGLTQLTNSTGRTNAFASINADGTRITFYSNGDLTGGNPDGNYEIFLWTQGSGITQLTNTTGGGNFVPSINADGTKIAIRSYSDLTGGNPDGNFEIFLWTQGSGITQLTNTTGGGYDFPSINADGTKIAFQSANNLTGDNPDGNWEIFLWTSGSGITQITNTTGGDNGGASINADGTRITFVSPNNLTGGNPDGNPEIFLYTQGSGITQLTNTTGGENFVPSINADGTRITFYSNGDLTSGNPDGNPEIFLYTQGSGITQLTNTTGGENFVPSINADGTKIAFQSFNNLTGGNADGGYEIFLAGSASVDLQASGAGPGPTLINPVTVTYTLQGCSGKEVYLVVNAPAMGMPWAYLSVTGWLPLPADLATLTPYLSSGPADGTYTLYADTAPAGAYELYLGCDNVLDGHLNIDTSAGLNVNGVYDYLAVTVSP